MINISCKGTNTQGNKTLYTSVNDCSKRSVSAPSANRPFARCPKPLFQSEAKCEAIDTTMTFYSRANKIHFHKKSFTVSLVLKVRVFETRKRHITSCDGPPACVMTDETRTAAEKT